MSKKTNDWRVAFYVEVEDPTALLRAAQAQALREGGDPADLLRNGHPIIKDCLVMVLDPGSIPGCSIDRSTAGPADDVESRFS